MEKFIDILDKELGNAFESAGYDSALAKVVLSNRPDLCEYQCNGALAGAKKYKKAPIMIAKDVEAILKENDIFKEVEAVAPGFLNLSIDEKVICDYLSGMSGEENLGIQEAKEPQMIMVDYGGPNVAKPLHVGHLRSAVIGESIKRIGRKMGHKVLGDIHLGDWGYQMGLIITEVKIRHPELPYFDAEFTYAYPDEAPFTINELEEIYPTASGKAKEDAQYREEALNATFQLQNGNKGYYALWKHIMNVSVTDLKKNYEKLNVHFDLWMGESDAQKYIPPMVQKMKDDGYAHEDDGALVVDVKEETDTKEIPPCIILKSDGASLYSTTDLATLVQREKDYNPDSITYLADKRQDLHFLQVFRAAKKTKIVPEDTKLTFLGFGTMNGKDGKPFKTRDGGVMRLESLISDIQEEMFKKITENRVIDETEAREIAQVVGIAALKYGDLSNQAAKDYVFDMERFTSFEGNTGPYVLYTIVRIKSILNRYVEGGGNLESVKLMMADSKGQKELMMEVLKYNEVMEQAFVEQAPHKICGFIYDISNNFNKFYHETKILAEEIEEKKESYIALLLLTKRVLESCIDVLGFEAPERM
ncbi:arginyl-tRNA synthetase [Aequitasia blattaphilus]|uniref:Arginine--tRNA ligase n=1 Tax=Aequitasia blattaphilus TaxID=2949332 RepID=A0ABT1ECB3_9FIRM|nr:arginine--tRNA ligase [Aequitasia blattaphilus]MCP1103475.1 arginine--tRNA ligase [Aequitasia blattaphilus]MCR8616115.1 arginine--tRNA ligase [Aequitasia blattaphilus]